MANYTQLKYARVLNADYAIPYLRYDSTPANGELQEDILSIIPLLKPLSAAPMATAHATTPYKIDNCVIQNTSTYTITNDDITALSEGYILEPAGDEVIGCLIGGLWEYEYIYFGALLNYNGVPGLSAFTLSTDSKSLDELYPVFYQTNSAEIQMTTFDADGTMNTAYARKVSDQNKTNITNLEDYLVLYDDPVFETIPTFDQQSFLMGLACGLLGKGLPKMIGEEPEDDPESEWPISWNTAEIASNPVQVTIDDVTFVKISDYTPTNEELSSISLYVEQYGTYLLTLPLTASAVYDLCIMAMYNNAYVLLSVTSAGESADLGISFPETGFYVMGMEEDFTLSIISTQLYAYNGVELPDINTVWTDKESYPYAGIASMNDGTYYLSAFAKEPYISSDNLYLMTPEEQTYKNWTLSDTGIWTDESDVTVTSVILELSYANTKWASFDVLNADGTVYLAASEPVAV